MAGLVAIDIPEENPVTRDSARRRDDDVNEDNVLILGVSNVHKGRGEKEIEEDKEQPDGALPPPQPRYRSYFEVLDDDQLAHELLLQPVEETRLPITFKPITNYLKWTIPTPPRVKKSHYDIVLGISAKTMDLDAVEAIVITVIHNIGDSPLGKSEVITSQELRRLCSDEVQDKTEENKKNASRASRGSEATFIASDDGCFRWKLHEKLILHGQQEEGKKEEKEEEKEDKSTMIVMEVKTWQGESTDYGLIELHYTEILTDAQAFYMDDPMYREHRPFIHTIDLNRTGCLQLDTDPQGPKRVTDYTISGDGSHVLVTTVAGDHRFLQLWNFKEPLPVASPPRSRKESNNSRQSTCSKEPPTKPFQPQLVAWMQLPMAHEIAYDYCLSWNGSQLVYIDLDRLDAPDVDDEEEELANNKACRKNGTICTESPLKNDTAFYKVDTRFTEVPPGAIAGSGFRRFNAEERCPQLRDFFAKSAFHIVATQDQDIRDELFVTCDGITIEVYNVFEEWIHLRTIRMDHPWSVPRFAVVVFGALLKQLCGPYLVIGNPDAYEVSTWDIEQGVRLSSYMDLTYEQFEAVRFSTSMSKDGRLIAIPGKHHVDIFWTTTWTRAASYTIHEMEHDPSIGSVRFIRNDTQLTVEYNSSQLFYQRNRGCVFNTDSMALVEKYVVDGCDTFVTSSDHATSPHTICIGVSQLSLFNLEDRMFQSPSIRKRHCQESCFSYDSYIYDYAETLAPTGLVFKAEKSIVPVIVHDRRVDQPFVTITVSDKGLPVQRMSVPLPKDLNFNIHRLNFIGNCSHLSLSLEGLVLIWSTPQTPQDKFTLRLVHTFSVRTDWEVCIHGQLFGLLPDYESVVSSRSLDDPIRGTEADFLGGSGFLSEIFQNAGKELQEDIIHYIGKYINFYISGTDCDSNIVQYTCSKWMAETHRSTVLLWRALLSHPTGRWIPRHDMNKDTNPIHCLLAKTGEHPKAFELAEVFIEYCTRQAKLEKDPHFLLPIRQCLRELTDPKKPYSEVTQELFRELAYIPVRNHDYIVEHHKIAHSWKFRWKFWKPIPRGLHQYRDQVLQVTSAPTAHAPKYIFSRDIYLATFDMLWLKKGSDPSHSEDPEMSEESIGFHSWPFVIKALISRRLRFIHNPTIVCHPFEHKTLDNPAIAALVKYKWNTIGHQYWLLRFLTQCVYYVLVLVGVFMQIYSYSNVDAMNGVFIAIIVMASMFLWLEFFQLLEDTKQYLGSVYNMVDLFAFVTPLVASILQLVWSDSDAQNSLFSFSVLFLFLHFLFELRVIRGVCKFVSIIIHAISSIRVFFFVFAGGLLAFAIAIMHLLHTCTDADVCPSYTDDFSFNMFRVLSMTYFMMGGMYDPVNNGFKHDDVGFHMMMVVFFFFTVILMLNVLIALINHAIDDGDRTWELDWLQNRMRYVESAENFTYNIPGFRAAHDFFPETIYYTATALQVRDYKKTTKSIKEQNASTFELATVSEIKTRVSTSSNSSGIGQDWQPQLEESTASNACAGGGGDNGAAVLAMLKQFQEEQNRAREEQQRVYEELRFAHEEQRQAANELKKELALLKEDLRRR
ncbi:hypothetical protein BGZ95_009621 [Linnemannia exigua]|uniref:Ion transport domain-containing protein n=1 Tax=Linnemannia exigua TaxID=604196 RepID=A0AAD4DCX6_9FUNG|nr:hypothetical protein BGZ95_009621 [Linnemannia exigua]